MQNKKNSFLKRLTEGLKPATMGSTEFDFVFPVFSNYRTRSDFSYQDGALGWYDQQKKFLPIEFCPLHSDGLKDLVHSVSQVSWPIRKGSFRFRIGNEGLKGLWLDFANLDIKALLSTGDLLESLLEKEIILEMGQKGKRVRYINGEYKLTDPTPAPWFSTLYQDQPALLEALISSFTQTNPDLNHQMIRIIKCFLGDSRFDTITEFGSGVGNFTLMLSERADRLSAIENDIRNLVPLKKNLERYKINEKVEIFDNLSQFSKQASSNSRSLYFVNPARSGVGALFDGPLAVSEVIYVSCYMDSFLSDVVKLQSQGFKLSKATLFDQFPNSQHFEIISLFTR